MTPHVALLMVLASCAGTAAKRAGQGALVLGAGALLVSHLRTRRD